MRTASSRTAAAAVLLALTGVVAGCGIDANAAGAGFPDACTAAFPMAAPNADLDDVELVPDDFPDPPVDATLCLVTGTAATGVNLEYVSDASPQHVLDGYLEAFSSYAAVSLKDSEGVSARAGEVNLVVRAGAGRYTVELRSA